MLDAQQDDGSDALTPAQRAAMRRRVRKEVMAERGLDHVPAPKRQLITGSQGTGKTTTAISEIAAGREEVIIWVTEPTRAKAEEVAGDYRNIAARGSPPAKVVYGRSADDPDRPGETMCPRHVVAQKIAARGLSVRETLCSECPLRETCGFLRQAGDIMAMGRCGVFFMARDYLFLPACPAPNPDIIIADEVLTITAVDEVVEFPPSLLRTVLQCCGGPEEDLVRAGAVLQCLHDALHHPRTLALLRDSGVQTKELTFVKVLLETELKFRRTRFCINGRMSDFAIEAGLATVETGEIGQVLACVKAILKEMPTGRDQLNAVVYDAAQEVMVNGRKERQPRIRVHALRPMRPIKRKTTVLSSSTAQEARC